MTRDDSLDIAVTGVAARFPGASDLAGWWSALTEGRVLTTRYRREDLVAAGIAPKLVDDPDYVPVRGHLDRAEHFDNQFFRISPRDAELMDPQHRLMLEVAWAALEDSGLAPVEATAQAPREAASRTAVFASATGSSYMRAVVSRTALGPAELDDLVHGTEHDFMASRVAYKLGLTGPALAVQTACSSSLVAVHLAVQALRHGDCEQALVVASGYEFPQGGYLYLPGGVQSKSGNCRPFDEGADGVVGGSGVACVVLRRLRDALRDGQLPHGVILGTATNNDGSAKAGYYAPSPAGQEAAIRSAVRAADVDATSIGFLEAHGTGTRIGDPIEWAAASAALSRLGASDGQIAVGAVKANIGHLDAAAGLAGLIKTLMVVKHAVIPPVAGFTRANPLLDMNGSPLRIPQRAAPWDGPQPRRAGVSAFGIGGTNAHIVVEQAPHPEPAGPPDSRPRLVVLSAADPQALARNTGHLADHLDSADPDLADVCFTLAAGRTHLPHRLAVTGRDRAEVAKRLRTNACVMTGRTPVGGPAPLVFLFPGQGTQRPGMAQAYLRALPGFDEALQRCLDAFEYPFASELRRAVLDDTFPAEALDETALAQPALFAVGWAAAVALLEMGLSPAAVAGHSLGEITAACVAGVLDLEDAASLVAARGRAMQDCPPGAMLALGCDAESARRLLARAGCDLDLAAVNGPSSCVVSGPIEAVEALRSAIGGEVFTRRLRTARAFHSRLIEPARARIDGVLKSIPWYPLRVPLLANLDGRFIPAGADFPKSAFVEQARVPVQFGAMMSTLVSAWPTAVVLEIGPGRALSALAEAAGLTTVAPAGTAEDSVLAALGALWTLGQPVSPVDRCGSGRRRLHLPGYRFCGPRWIAGEAVDRDVVQRSADTVVVDAAPDPVALLTSAWAELLGHDDLTSDSDFFELGGDSLLITRLARRVNTELGIRVPIRDMLASRTLGRQAALVAEIVSSAAVSPAGQNAQAPAPASVRA